MNYLLKFICSSENAHKFNDFFLRHWSYYLLQNWQLITNSKATDAERFFFQHFLSLTNVSQFECYQCLTQKPQVKMIFLLNFWDLVSMWSLHFIRLGKASISLRVFTQNYRPVSILSIISKACNLIYENRSGLDLSIHAKLPFTVLLRSGYLIFTVVN